MFRSALNLLTVCLLACTFASAQAQPAVTPFKLGNFELQGKPLIGIVLNDTLIIDLAAANAAIKSTGPAMDSPADMKALISAYDTGLRTRIVEIVAAVNAMPETNRPAWVHALPDLKVKPAIMYPVSMMNAALNYTEHALEMEGVRDDGVDGSAEPGIAAKESTRPAGIWEPQAKDRRWTPYMFQKASSAVIAHEETIHLPAKRTQIDWECELGVVIGRDTKHVATANAADYIFGYTLEMDISDREGRGDTRYGSDWLMGKSHDTFAPLGPFIVPREFVQNPSDLDIRFVLNGQVMQESNSKLMIHNVFELVEYASNILTLRAGDIIATGTPSGVGSARKPPIYLQDGDKTECTYEGIGTMKNSVVRDK